MPTSRDESLYARFQESGKDFPRHDDSEADGSRSSTPDALAAHAHEMLNQPSAEFSRQVWWEALTRYYGGPKAAATRRIMDDISHLFVPVLPFFCILADMNPVFKFSSL